MVLRKTEKVNFSGEEAGPYAVVVIRSWRRAQERLRREVVSRDILSRRRRIGGWGGEGAFTMKRICPQRRLVDG